MSVKQQISFSAIQKVLFSHRFEPRFLGSSKQLTAAILDNQAEFCAKKVQGGSFSIIRARKKCFSLNLLENKKMSKKR